MKKKIKEKDGMESRGERLRKLREAKGLSLEEVHRRTKIHIGILQALEKDAVDNLAPAYVKGLLKIYCVFLGVAAEDFIADYAKKVSNTGGSDSGVIKPGPDLVKPHVNVAVVKRQIKLRPLIVIAVLLILAASAFKFGRNISAYKALQLKKPVLPDVVVLKPQTPSLAQPVLTKLKLGISAKEDCWLEVILIPDAGL
ncbi:helix-turn-helix domain-containing protein [Candidatus Omnitrophota bacterium]